MVVLFEDLELLDRREGLVALLTFLPLDQHTRRACLRVHQSGLHPVLDLLLLRLQGWRLRATRMHDTRKFCTGVVLFLFRRFRR